MIYDWAPGGVLTQDGRPLGEIARSWFRERAELSIAGGSWTFRAAGSAREAVTTADDVVHCRAHRLSFFGQGWAVTGEGGEYEIRPAGLFTGALAVTRGGQEIGRITSSGIFTTRPTLDLDQSVPTVDALFLLWIGFVIRARRNTAASS